MFKSNEIAKVAEHAIEVVKVLSGLTVGEAQLVLKQAEVVISQVQRIDAANISRREAAEAVRFNIEGC